MTTIRAENTRPLTTGQVAQYCGVNYRTVIRWIERGQLKAFQLPGGRGDNRVEANDFVAFLVEHQMPVPIELGSRARRVLVVDDEPTVAVMIQRVLDHAGFETRVAHNGFRAGALLGTFGPSVMTLDLEMPGLGGLDVLNFVRTSDQLKQTKVLIVSALEQGRLQEAINAGANAAMSKPIDAELLVKHVERLL